MPSLEGKVAIVTGAGRGIGREHALALARAGAKVVVNDLGGTLDGQGQDATPAQSVVNEIVAAGGQAVASYDDVSNFDAAEHMIGRAVERYGRLDILVNNAGILRDRMLVNMTEDEWDAVIAVHLKGHFAPTRHAAAYWRERSKEGEEVRGRVINTSSPSGVFGNVGQANYGAAKAGIAAFTQIVAMEMGRFGVTVNAIAPGARTRMTEAAYGARVLSANGFDPLDPANIAPLVVHLASDGAGHISGQVFRVHGGHIELFEGWHPVAAVDKDGRWDPSELAGRVDELFDGRETRYSASAIHDPGA